MIKLENISFAYQEKIILKDFSYPFETNKITCLLGGSGSGKTTILRLIAGLETPQNGKILMDEQLLARDNKTLIPPNQRNLGFIFQDLALWPHFTVYKNIALGLSQREETDIEGKVSTILTSFGIENTSKKFVHEISGGQQQLVAIARALVLQPKTLLLDEPLNNLDVKLKRDFLQRIIRLKQEHNLTIIYVTHDHKEAFTIADNVVVLNRGKIEDQGTVEEIKKSTNQFVNYFLEF